MTIGYPYNNDQSYELDVRLSGEYDDNGTKDIEVEFTVEELDFIQKVADAKGMELNDYINHVLYNAIMHYGDPDMVCPTCNNYRRNNAEPCPQCGELN